MIFQETVKTWTVDWGGVGEFVELNARALATQNSGNGKYYIPSLVP
jgi:hypothetical protein